MPGVRHKRRLPRRHALRRIKDRLRGTIIIAQCDQHNIFIVIAEVVEILERRALKR
jgi:hypothetical protein